MGRSRGGNQTIPVFIRSRFDRTKNLNSTVEKSAIIIINIEKKVKVNSEDACFVDI